MGGKESIVYYRVHMRERSLGEINEHVSFNRLRGLMLSGIIDLARHRLILSL